MRRLIASLLAVIVGSIVVAVQPVSAASGDVTSTPFSAPASVAGQTLKSSFADSTGGTFQVYQSGQILTMIRVDKNGVPDAKFGSGGTVAIGVPSQLASSGAMGVSGHTNPKTSTWWVATYAVGTITNSVDVALTSGSLTGTVAVNTSVSAASIIANCASTTTGADKYQIASLFARRNGGVWMSNVCATPTSTQASVTFTPLTATGVQDTSATVFSGSASHGGAGNCAVFAAVADPTSVSPAPELWIVRTEFSRTPCSTNPAATTSETTAVSSLAISETGVITRTELTTTKLLANAVRIDPGGRPVFLTTDMNDSTKIYMSRLKTDGTLDTTVGTNGFLLLETGALPAGAIGLSVSLVGVVTTADRVYFAILLNDREVNIYQNNSTTPRTHGFRMALAAPSIGWAPNYGTGGIGQRLTTQLAENAYSLGKTQSTGNSVNLRGQPVNFSFTDSTASYNVWGAITGATGGGEGGTGLGGYTTDTGGAPSLGVGGSDGSESGSGPARIDSTVYAKLPKTTELNTAFVVLTAKQSLTHSIVSSTTKTCVPVGRRLALIGTGTCSARIQNKATKKTVRTLRTKVTTKVSTAGTTMIASDPILFSANSSTISAKALKQIRIIANDAKDSAGILIVGHATSLPKNQSNLPLSRKRAQAVHNYLAKLNVTVPVTKVGKGSTEPASTKKTPAGYAKNRRAVVYIIPSK